MQHQILYLEIFGFYKKGEEMVKKKIYFVQFKSSNSTRIHQLRHHDEYLDASTGRAATEKPKTCI